MSEDGPLAGIRVLDLTRILAGPLCTMMLGDMGADVIKVEPPETGDDTRAWGPPFLAGDAVYFLGVNRNKRSLTLNMAVPAGQKILAGLIEKADVLIDNFKLGTLEKWGFTDACFERQAPRLVRCSITGYGSSGPKAALPGYDFILQAESGLMSICGEPEGKPTKYGVAIVDVCTGMLASNSILAALNARERTGNGQKVELSLYETSLAMLVNVAASYLAAGRNAGRFGNGHPSIVPYASYQAADAMIALGVGNERQFARLADVLGHPEWAKDARFASNRARVENRAVIDSLISEALSHDKADAWLAKLKAAGIPCGKINSVAEALEDSQTAARKMIETIEHPTVGALKMLGIPFKFSDTACSVRRPPPTLGQHSEEILSGELGLDDKAIADLRRQKVI
ncbi:MAG: formyl-CoA transferase [Alphaproteobacteria bacterium 13_2_20CM_2_64_7]|jgi:succinate--hydroxymethylglutarate CoA-transferase|nr:MAG: formyl-CoA transferase [Alphaproteobacteria bacterium 13_2_20CM_2_64_7]